MVKVLDQHSGDLGFTSISIVKKMLLPSSPGVVQTQARDVLFRLHVP